MEGEIKIECLEKPNVIVFTAPVSGSHGYGNKLYQNYDIDQSYDCSTSKDDSFPDLFQSSSILDSTKIPSTSKFQDEIYRRSSISTDETSSDESEYSEKANVKKKCNLCGYSFKNLKLHNQKVQ